MFILVFLYITMGLGIALSVFSLVASVLDLVSKSKTPALSYENRWANPDYVAMIHLTRQLEKDNGIALSDCKCRPCNPPKPPRGSAGVSRAHDPRVKDWNKPSPKELVTVNYEDVTVDELLGAVVVPRRQPAAVFPETRKSKRDHRTIKVYGQTVSWPSNVPSFATMTILYKHGDISAFEWAWKYDDTETLRFRQPVSDILDEFTSSLCNKMVDGSTASNVVPILVNKNRTGPEALKFDAPEFDYVERKSSGIKLRTPVYNDQTYIINAGRITGGTISTGPR